MLSQDFDIVTKTLVETIHANVQFKAQAKCLAYPILATAIRDDEYAMKAAMEIEDALMSYSTLPIALDATLIHVNVNLEFVSLVIDELRETQTHLIAEQVLTGYIKAMFHSKAMEYLFLQAINPNLPSIDAFVRDMTWAFAQDDITLIALEVGGNTSTTTNVAVSINMFMDIVERYNYQLDEETLELLEDITTMAEAKQILK